VAKLHKYITEHVTLFFSHMDIIPVGRTVTLGTLLVKTTNFWQFWQSTFFTELTKCIF